MSPNIEFLPWLIPYQQIELWDRWCPRESLDIHWAFNPLPQLDFTPMRLNWEGYILDCLNLDQQTLPLCADSREWFFDPTVCDSGLCLERALISVFRYIWADQKLLLPLELALCPLPSSYNMDFYFSGGNLWCQAIHCLYTIYDPFLPLIGLVLMVIALSESKPTPTQHPNGKLMSIEDIKKQLDR